MGWGGHVPWWMSKQREPEYTTDSTGKVYEISPSGAIIIPWSGPDPEKAGFWAHIRKFSQTGVQRTGYASTGILTEQDQKRFWKNWRARVAARTPTPQPVVPTPQPVQLTQPGGTYGEPTPSTNTPTPVVPWWMHQKPVQVTQPGGALGVPTPAPGYGRDERRGSDVGWFDEAVGAVEAVAGVVAPVVGAVQAVQSLWEDPAPAGAPLYAPGGNYGPAYTPGGYYAPPSGAPPAALQYQNQQQGMMGYPPLPSYQQQYQPYGPQAGGFFETQAYTPLPGSFGDQVTPDFFFPPVGSGAAQPGTFFGITTGGRPKTKNVIEAIDWNGERRYWVGGVKMSRAYIKKMVLSSQRKKRCPRHHHHSKH